MFLINRPIASVLAALASAGVFLLIDLLLRLVQPSA